MGQYSNRNKYGGKKMKKVLLSVLLIASIITLTSCSKDDEADFNYPMETLYGTWKGTDIKVDGSWIDVTSWLYSKFAFSITFHSDGTYSGKGYFGNGSGTYTAKGKTIITYVNGKEYLRYEVKSLSNNIAELSMTVDGSGETLEVKVKKK